MSEMDELKNRIKESSIAGVETAHIRDDHEPIGDLMIRQLTDSGEYVTRKGYGALDQKWRVFTKENAPY